MAASAAGISRLSSIEHRSLHDKLNAEWHERALQLFMVIVLGHWAEHLVQAWQIWYLHWPRAKAGGILGLFYPWLVQSEVLHYGFAIVMLIGIWVLRKGFTGRSLTWWTISLGIQFWHHIEHLLLFTQAMMHHNFWHKPVPFSFLQLVFPRVELHLFYNTVVFIPMVIAMYYHMFPPEGEPHTARCSCEWTPKEDEVGAAA
jgi:hypothetical protein